MRLGPRLPPPLAGVATCVAACIAAAPAFAIGFEINDDIRGAWNNTIAVGAAIRVGNPDPQLVGFNNANQYPGAYGAVSAADDANLNFRKGQVTTAPLIWATDLELRYRNQYGLFVRGRAWYDMQLENHGVPHGHSPNGYIPGAKLDDSGFYSTDKFTGTELQDAYVYGNFDLGQSRLTVRLGQQTINWGEGLLYVGINAFNPLNFSAAGRPGSRLDDALVPVNRLYANLITREGLSLEAFYALDWKRSNIPACGTYGGLSDIVNEPTCNAFTVGAPFTDQQQLAAGAFLPFGGATDPGKGGQYGLAARYFVESLRTEFGAYYVRFNNPNPSLGVVPKDPTSRIGASYVTSYVEGVQGMALSAVTGYRNMALAAELSAFRKLPMARNAPTLVQGGTGKGPYASLPDTPVGEAFPGYFEGNRTQLILSGRFDLSPTIGLADAQLTAETAMQWVTNLPGLDKERLGRNPNFGVGSYPGTTCGGYNVCTTDGFATRFAWGYRLLAQFSLPRPANGLDLQPVALWSQDLKGYAADGSIVQGRWTAGLLLRAVYQQVFFAEIGRTWLRRDTEFDPLRDRAVYLITAGMRI